MGVEIKDTKERIAALEDRLREGEKLPGKEDREAHVRIDKLEKDIAKDRADRQEFEWNVEGEKGIQDAKDSEKDMEKRLEGAMEQVKILNLDLGKECADMFPCVSCSIAMLFTCTLVRRLPDSNEGLSVKHNPLEQTARYWVG
jgi:hypothetical protein